METRLGEIDGEMASCARDFVKLNELTEEKTQLETQLEEKWIAGRIWKNLRQKYFNKMHKKVVKLSEN